MKLSTLIKAFENTNTTQIKDLHKSLRTQERKRTNDPIDKLQGLYAASINELKIYELLDEKTLDHLKKVMDGTSYFELEKYATKECHHNIFCAQPDIDEINIMVLEITSLENVYREKDIIQENQEFQADVLDDRYVIIRHTGLTIDWIYH